MAKVAKSTKPQWKLHALNKRTRAKAQIGVGWNMEGPHLCDSPGGPIRLHLRRQHLGSPMAADTARIHMAPGHAIQFGTIGSIYKRE